MDFESIGLQVPTILLPRNGVDMTKWAVVACDQYTAEEEYWQRARKFIGDAPSTLNIILPEVYLESADKEERIRNINNKMGEYVEGGVLTPQEPGFILVDRKTPSTKSRKGLVVALDLERYDYSKGSQTLIRATEGTIVERLPPRVRIRENAAIELPHIMVLIDDPKKTVIEPLFKKKLKKAYDFDLMAGSGHIRGLRVTDEKLLEGIAEKLGKLADQKTFDKKYKVSGKGVLLYAMGDGNHSLATAKAIWERLKENASDKKAVMNHPARYALVELVNVHDKGLEFEPIHRVVFGVDVEDMLKAMESYYKAEGSQFTSERFNSQAKMRKELKKAKKGVHAISFVAGKEYGILYIKKPKLNLEVGTLQTFLDKYLKEKCLKVDYIHGDEVVTTLGAKTGNIGFLLPAMSKHELFRTVILDGALPRKTFSMGHAPDKRFYIECRKIV
ncbi:MAG: DUF1015 domain-containing protein [Candidatus Altiarchaeota archaeon]